MRFRFSCVAIAISLVAPPLTPAAPLTFIADEFADAAPTQPVGLFAQDAPSAPPQPAPEPPAHPAPPPARAGNPMPGAPSTPAPPGWLRGGNAPHAAWERHIIPLIAARRPDLAERLAALAERDPQRFEMLISDALADRLESALDQAPSAAPDRRPRSRDPLARSPRAPGAFGGPRPDGVSPAPAPRTPRSPRPAPGAPAPDAPGHGADHAPPAPGPMPGAFSPRPPQAFPGTGPVGGGHGGRGGGAPFGGGPPAPGGVGGAFGPGGGFGGHAGSGPLFAVGDELRERHRASIERERAHAHRAEALASEWRRLAGERGGGTEDAEREAKLRSELEAAIREQFDARTELRRLELERLECELQALRAALEQLRAELNRRDAERDRLIELRERELQLAPGAAR